MWFAEAGIAAADAGSELVPEMEFAQLAMDAVAITTGDEAKSVTACEQGQHAARAAKKLWAMAHVVLAPDLVGGAPFRTVEIRGAIDVVPVG